MNPQVFSVLAQHHVDETIKMARWTNPLKGILSSRDAYKLEDASRRQWANTPVGEVDEYGETMRSFRDQGRSLGVPDDEVQRAVGVHGGIGSWPGTPKNTTMAQQNYRQGQLRHWQERSEDRPLIGGNLGEPMVFGRGNPEYSMTAEEIDDLVRRNQGSWQFKRLQRLKNEAVPSTARAARKG